jgi:hypothetical protein
MHSWPLHQTEVSGKLHSAATLPGGMVGPEVVWRRWSREKYLPFWKATPVIQPVTIQLIPAFFWRDRENRGKPQDRWPRAENRNKGGRPEFQEALPTATDNSNNNNYSDVIFIRKHIKALERWDCPLRHTTDHIHYSQEFLVYLMEIYQLHRLYKVHY